MGAILVDVSGLSEDTTVAEASRHDQHPAAGSASRVVRKPGGRHEIAQDWASPVFNPGNLREELESWVDRVLDATRLEDVFGSE